MSCVIGALRVCCQQGAVAIQGDFVSLVLAKSRFWGESPRCDLYWLYWEVTDL
jgi:hypothetical protein